MIFMQLSSGIKVIATSNLDVDFHALLLIIRPVSVPAILGLDQVVQTALCKLGLRCHAAS